MGFGGGPQEGTLPLMETAGLGRVGIRERSLGLVDSLGILEFLGGDTPV